MCQFEIKGGVAIIPEGVTEIVDNVFAGCEDLISVVIPSTVKVIGTESFLCCRNLVSVVISEGVTEIEDNAFTGCAGITSVVIPNSVEVVSELAFCGCEKLTSIVVKEGNKVYDSRENCNAIIKTETDELIVGCASTVIPNSVEVIGACAFIGCKGLANIAIPEGVKKIKCYAFANCEDLTNIAIPESVKEIENCAFADCTGLTSIVIPDSIEVIGNMVFTGCTGLTSIVIPNSVEVIGNRVFDGCENLASIIVEGGNKVYDSRENCNGIIKTGTNELIASCSSTVLPDSVELPNVDDYYNEFEDEDFDSIGEVEFKLMPSKIREIIKDGVAFIPYGVTKIGEHALGRYCLNVTSVVIPNTVKVIGDKAFCECLCLKNVVIPNSVEFIGNSAFSDCGELAGIVVEEGNKVYDSRENCNAIIKTETNELIVGCSSTTIPNSVRIVGDGAFDGCTNLTNIIIPNSVKIIGAGAFYRCVNLTNIVIPNSVEFIGESAFSYCEELAGIVVEEGNKVYDSRENCNAIINTAKNELVFGFSSTVIPNSVETIGDYAFNGCVNLTSIVIPNSVKSIGEGAFFSCAFLTSVFIPESVTEIKDYTFNRCESLTDIVIPESVIKIGDSAFVSCISLVSIVIPSSVEFIGESVFEDCVELTSIMVKEGNKVYDSRENCNAIIKTETNELIASCSTTVLPDSVELTCVDDEDYVVADNDDSETVTFDLDVMKEEFSKLSVWDNPNIDSNRIKKTFEKVFSIELYPDTMNDPRLEDAFKSQASSELEKFPAIWKDYGYEETADGVKIISAKSAKIASDVYPHYVDEEAIVWDADRKEMFLYIPDMENPRLAFKGTSWICARKLKDEYSHLNLYDVYMEIKRTIEGKDDKRLTADCNCC